MELILFLFIIFGTITIFVIEKTTKQPIKQSSNKLPKKIYDGKDKLIAGIIVRNKQCWKCHQATRVIAVRLFSSYKDLKIYMSPRIIPDHVCIPKELLDTIQVRFPFYKKNIATLKNHMLQQIHVKIVEPCKVIFFFMKNQMVCFFMFQT